MDVRYAPGTDRYHLLAILIAKWKANSCLRLCNERNASRA